MIDPVKVEQRSRPFGPGPQPGELVLALDVPVVRRQAPVLAGGGEGVGRRAHPAIQEEVLLAAPDVGRVAPHHERQVALQGHPQRPGVGAGPVPLLVQQPLQPLALQDLVGQLAARLIQRRRLPRLQRLGPVPPGLVVAAVQRLEQGIVVDPGRGAASMNRSSALRRTVPGCHSLVAEVGERPVDGPALERPDVVPAHASARRRSCSSSWRSSSDRLRLAAHRREVLECRPGSGRPDRGRRPRRRRRGWSRHRPPR